MRTRRDAREEWEWGEVGGGGGEVAGGGEKMEWGGETGAGGGAGASTAGVVVSERDASPGWSAGVAMESAAAMGSGDRAAVVGAGEGFSEEEERGLPDGSLMVTAWMHCYRPYELQTRRISGI